MLAHMRRAMPARDPHRGRGRRVDSARAATQRWLVTFCMASTDIGYILCGGISLVRKRLLLGPCSRATPRALRCSSRGGGVFL